MRVVEDSARERSDSSSRAGKEAAERSPGVQRGRPGCPGDRDQAAGEGEAAGRTISKVVPLPGSLQTRI